MCHCRKQPRSLCISQCDKSSLGYIWSKQEVLENFLRKLQNKEQSKSTFIFRIDSKQVLNLIEAKECEATNLRSIKSRWLKCNQGSLEIIVSLASGIHLNRKQTANWNLRGCAGRVANIGESIQNSIGKCQSNKFNRYQGRVRMISKKLPYLQVKAKQIKLQIYRTKKRHQSCCRQCEHSEQMPDDKRDFILPLDCSSPINISIIHNVWLSHLSQEGEHGTANKKKRSRLEKLAMSRSGKRRKENWKSERPK